MRQFLKRIIDTLKSKKVEYGDVRYIEQEAELIMIKNGVLEAITHTTDAGFGVRLIKDSAWGFSSSNTVTKREADVVTRDALNIARASAKVKGSGITLAPVKAHKGSYRSNVKVQPMKVPLSKKIDLLMKCDAIMRKDPKIKVSTGFISFRRIKNFFASTIGSLLEQEMYFSGGNIKAFAMDKGDLQTRSYGNHRQAGYEFIDGLDLAGNAARIRDEAVMLLTAKPCPSQETTVILDSEQMVLQTHESCGHPTELDRVLGTEASYAGTSFMTTDKLHALKYGSDIVNIVADATTRRPGDLWLG
jgi:TldD protein